MARKRAVAKKIKPRKAPGLESGIEENENSLDVQETNENLNKDQEIMAEEEKEEGAPALIKERDKSDPPKPPESQDVEYLSYQEVCVSDRINTLDIVFVEDPTINYETHNGPWIERCAGRNPETHKLQVYKIPAKEVQVRADQVMQYLGSVVQDRLSVYTGNVIVKGRRWGYSFEKFYYLSGKRQVRCCFVDDRIHQAGLMYESVPIKSRKTIARIRQIKGHLGQRTGEPMYKILGAGESYYRDLKRLYERHFLKRGDESLADDIGLKVLIGH